MTVLTTISRSGAHAGAVNDDHSTGEVPERARRRTFTAAYKLRILAEYEAAEPGRRGEVLRREGLYSSHLVDWRRTRDAGALAATRGRPPADPVERDNARLRERNAKLEADLDTARRVIEVQGKVSALLEDLSKRAHDASAATTLPSSGPSSPPRSSR